MAVIAYCSECQALWAWLFHVALRCCHCPSCRHRLVPARRARPRWKGHDVPIYHVGSFDVCRELHVQQARRSGVRIRPAWQAAEQASDFFREGRAMIDCRCLLCLEYHDVLGNCPGADTPGGQFAVLEGKLACWTPIPACGPEIDPLSGELVHRTPGPEFPDGLVDRLLSSGPVSNASDGSRRAGTTADPGAPGPAADLTAAPGPDAVPPRRQHTPAGRYSSPGGSATGSGEPQPAARVRACTTGPALAEPWRGAARIPRRLAGLPAANQELRCCCAGPSSAGVKSATSRVADSQGGWMVRFGIRGQLLVGLAFIGIAMPAAAMDGAAIYQPAAAQGRCDGRPGVPAELRPLLAAMRWVESKGDDNAVGDGGDSIGPYQIQLPYWLDGGGDAGRYRLDAWHADRCVPIILGYWRRYCPAALAAGDIQTLARCHNGGPQWNKTAKRRAATAEYWRKVKAALEAKR